jgi:hypothetical protein
LLTSPIRFSPFILPQFSTSASLSCTHTLSIAQID